MFAELEDIYMNEKQKKPIQGQLPNRKKKSLATVLKKCDSLKTVPEDASSSLEDEDASVYKPGDGML